MTFQSQVQPRTLTPDDEVRLFAGLAVQPLLVGVLTLLSYPLIFADRHAAANVYPGPAGLVLALYFGVAALVITIACVFPTVVWLVKRQPVQLTMALIYGLVFGNIPVLLATAGGGGGLRFHAFASMLGLFGAAAFWLISIRGRDFSRDPALA